MRGGQGPGGAAEHDAAAAIIVATEAGLVYFPRDTGQVILPGARV